MKINLLTLNCRGAIKDSNKRGCLKEFFKAKKLNIVLLQETHIAQWDYKEKIENELECKSYWSFGSNSSRGTSILIFNNFEYEVLNFKRDSEGRVVTVDVKIENNIFKIASIYCPNEEKERKTFLDNLNIFLMGTQPLILGGDWNFIEDLKLDKIGGNLERGNIGFENIKKIKESFSLIDPYRAKFKTKIDFTWFDEERQIKTRIDRFYLNTNLNKHVSAIYNSYSGTSDHYGVSMELDLNNYKDFNSGKGIWMMNVNLLNNDSFIREIEEFWLNQITSDDTIDLAWWDNCKHNFKKIAIKHSIDESKNFQNKLRDLEEGLRQVDCLMINCTDLTLLDRLKLEKSDIKAKISSLYSDKFKGAQIRSRCKILDDNEDPNSHFLKLEVTNGRRTKIEKLKKSDGSFTETTEESLLEGGNFYTNLYKFEKINDNLKEKFLLNLPQVPIEIKNELERDMTDNEFHNTLNSSNNNIRPGSDGLPAEFYKQFWYLFGHIFTQIAHKIYDNDELSFTVKTMTTKIN